MTIEEFIQATNDLAKTLDVNYSHIEINIDLRRIGTHFYVYGINFDATR